MKRIEDDNDLELIRLDSDDDWSSGFFPENEPNTLVVVPVHFILGDVFLDWNYKNRMSDGWSPATVIPNCAQSSLSSSLVMSSYFDL